jgi:hypothetical protein
MIQHTFKTTSHDLVGLFYGVNTLARFKTNLEKQAKLDIIRYDADTYKGDGFEFFIEVFLALHPCDNRIGVYNYTPIQEDDNGVDGIGVNILNEKCVVQIKYRNDAKTLLTANTDHLSNLISDGMFKHNVVSDNVNLKNYRHFVFTTADGLHFYTDAEMYKGKVKCFGYNDLRGMVDNNIPFWNKVREIVLNINS